MKIKIEYKKLGRTRAMGLAYKAENRIEIDERLTGYDLFATLIHEIMHIQNKYFEEDKIEADSDQMAEILWKQMQRKGIISKTDNKTDYKQNK